MKLKEYSLEELEQMSYSEITEIILTEKGGKLKIVDIFKKICTALKLSDAEFENHIADFFELVSTDGRFIILDKGYCDLRKKHIPDVIVEEEDVTDSSEDIEAEDDIIDSEETEEEDIYYDSSSDEDDVDDGDDELNDFIVVDDDDETSM